MWSFFHRFPASNSHGFIQQFLVSKASFYTEAEKPVTYILDLLNLDVPNLFASPPHSISETFQENLHIYISSTGLSRALVNNVDNIIVSWSAAILCNSSNFTYIISISIHFVETLLPMWQSKVEIEHCSIVYFYVL